MKMRMSDYDFENVTMNMDCVDGFMEVYRKFVLICREFNESWRAFLSDEEISNNAQDFATEYINMRTTKEVSETLRIVVKDSVHSLYGEETAETVDSMDDEEIDDMLWNIVEDIA